MLVCPLQNPYVDYLVPRCLPRWVMVIKMLLYFLLLVYNVSDMNSIVDLPVLSDIIVQLATLIIAFHWIYLQTYVQVYLEMPNGEKLAEALHSKVILIVNSSVFLFLVLSYWYYCYYGERCMLIFFFWWSYWLS